MAQTLDPVPFDNTNIVLCSYLNSSNKIQVVRITNIPNWYFERVVFPGQRLMFESDIKGQLEIHSGAMASSILEDTVPCARLRVDQAENVLNDIAVDSTMKRDADAAPAMEVMEPVHS